MSEVSFTTRELDEDESLELFEWLFDNADYITRIEQMTVKEIKRIIPIWTSYKIFNGQWTVSFTDIEVAVLFRLKWSNQ